jgi:transposase
LKKLFADGGYQGPEFNEALARVLPHLKAEIVKRSDQAKGFVVLPKRGFVEGTFAWRNRCRRLAKDWENLNRKALAFLRLASIRLMLRRLCNPIGSHRTDSNRLWLNLLSFVRPALPGYKEITVGQIEASTILVYRVLDMQWTAPV